MTAICGSRGLWFIFKLIFIVLSTSVCSVKCHKVFRAHLGEGMLRMEDMEKQQAWGKAIL